MFDTGNMGFMLLATSLVMLMTPGLAFFYGGLVGRKNVLAIMMQSYASMAVTTIVWWAVGYSLCFSGDFHGIIGILNTDIAASFAGPAWMLMAWKLERNVKFTGLLTGAVAGLATITPCAGYVTTTTAARIGTVSGVVCYFAVSLKNRLKWDDALDVWGVHGVGGVLGTIALGVFASVSVNSAGADGLLAGNSSFFLKQTVAVLGASVWAFGFT